MDAQQLKLDSAWWHATAAPDDPGARLCRYCGQWRPPTEWEPGRSWCRLCGNHKRAVWQDRQPDKRRTQRDRSLRHNYGISHETYDQMLADQEGRCAACNRLETLIDNRTHELRWLSVDHDHTTGKIRQLLCQECNAALGLLHEDSTRIQALAAYIMRHTTQEAQNHDTTI